MAVGGVRENPGFQDAHSYGDILFTLGKALVTEVRVVGGDQALCQRIEFATEANPVCSGEFTLVRTLVITGKPPRRVVLPGTRYIRMYPYPKDNRKPNRSWNYR